MKKIKLTEVEKLQHTIIVLLMLQGRRFTKREKQNVFVLFGSIETQGSIKSQENKDLVAEHYIKLIVPWAKLNADEKIKDAKVKLSKLTGNPDFVPPYPSVFIALSKLETDIKDADIKLVARAKNEPGSAPRLNVAVKLLYDDVKNLGTMVQLKMDTMVPAEAIRICQEAGYDYKAINVRGKRPNRVMKGTQPGQLLVWGEGQRGHQWEMSIDAGATFVSPPPPPTTGGVLEMENLISKKEYWFRHRLVLTKGRYGEWSIWYSGIAP